MNMLLVGAVTGAVTLAAAVSQPDARRLIPGEATYRIMSAENEAVRVVFRLSRQGDDWLDEFDNGLGITRTRFDRSLHGLEETIEFPGRPWQARVVVAGGRVKGTAALPASMGGERAIDLPAPPGLVMSPLRVLEADSLWTGRKMSVPVYSLTEGVQTHEYEVVGEARITVPAGTFETFRVTGPGGTMWLNRSMPHRLIAQENRGSAVRFELVSWEAAR